MTLNLKFFAVIGILAVMVIVAGIVAGPVLAQAVKAALIKNVDEPGRLPYEAQALFATGQCASSCADFAQNALGVVFTLPAVPNGKRLIIKSVTASLPTNAGAGTFLAFQSLTTVRGNLFKWAFYGPFPVSGSRAGMSSQNSFFTYGPGEKPVVSTNAIPAGDTTYEVDVTGYLIDVTN